MHVSLNVTDNNNNRVFTVRARPYSSITRPTCWCPYSGPYGATHKATCTRFAYTEDVVICVVICKTWTVSCLRCPIVTAKVLFLNLPLYVVGHQHVSCATDVRAW